VFKVSKNCKIRVEFNPIRIEFEKIKVPKNSNKPKANSLEQKDNPKQRNRMKRPIQEIGRKP